MTIPPTTEHLRFDGLRKHLDDIEGLSALFAIAFAEIPCQMFTWTFGGGETSNELRKKVFDRAEVTIRHKRVTPGKNVS